MRFTVSHEVNYALRALSVLAEREGACSAAALAEEAQVPEAFLLKIMQKLRTKKIVTGARGRSGGFALARAPQKITLLQIFEALGSPLTFCDCREHSCGVKDRHCRLKHIWRKSEDALREIFESTTLSDI